MSRFLNRLLGLALILGGLYGYLLYIGPEIGRAFKPITSHGPGRVMEVQCPALLVNERGTITATVVNTTVTDDFNFEFSTFYSYGTSIAACDTSRRIELGETVSVKCEITSSELGGKSGGIIASAIASQDRGYSQGMPNSYEGDCWIPTRPTALNVLAIVLTGLTVIGGIALLYRGLKPYTIATTGS